MDNDLINKEAILKIVHDHPFSYNAILKLDSNKNLLFWLNNKFTKLKDDIYTISTKINWLKNDLNDFPKCEVCGHLIGLNKNISINKKYPKTCCRVCSGKLSAISGINTRKNKYGDNCFSIQSKKTWKTINNDPIKKQQILNKRKSTCLKKYGVENVMQNTVIKNKAISTLINKYDGIGFSSKEIYNKYLLTNEMLYNDKKYNNYEKSKSTCLKKYGVENVFELNSVKNKIKTSRKHCRYNEWKQSEIIPVFLENEFEFNDLIIGSNLHWHCCKCNKDFNAPFDYNLWYRQGIPARCVYCNHLIINRSNAEMNIYDYIVNDLLVKNCNHNVKNIIPPLELDIYVPDRKLAFEFDGLYWHSEQAGKHNMYHLAKTILCEKQGIHLIHIFENEWDFKQDIVKSRIRNLFGLSEKTVYARKCEVKEVSSKESKDFQNENHIQGACNSSISIGLYYDNELVSLMTFGKSRFNKKYQYELLRFCNKINYHVPGGAGKLLSYFEKTYKPKSLISYADRRWSMNNENLVYDKLGFKLDHISKPDYWYVDKHKNIYSRIKYQKHKLNKLLKDFDPSKTEVENMLANGYFRIFDCGNFVYVKTFV